MKISEISVRIKRDVRHKPYVVSQCECSLTASVTSAEDLERSYKELHEDCLVIVEEMIERERRDYAIENQQRKHEIGKHPKPEPAPGDDVPF